MRGSEGGLSVVLFGERLVGLTAARAGKAMGRIRQLGSNPASVSA